MSDLELRRIYFEINEAPSYIEPKPRSGFLFRDDDYNLRGVLKASRPGASYCNGYASLKAGDVGFAERFSGMILERQVPVEFFAWVDGEKPDFVEGSFEFNCHVGEAKIGFETGKIARSCKVRCLAGPNIFGPNHATIKLSVYKYIIVIQEVWPLGKRSIYNEVTIDIESDEPFGEPQLKDILTALSFVSGRKIAEFETTFYDEQKSSICSILHSPRVFSKSEFNQTALSPFSGNPIYVQEDREKWSIAFSLSLALIERTPLREVLTNIWKARTLALGWNLVFYAAALESLTKAWAKYIGDSSDSLLVPNSEFKKFRRELSRLLPDKDKAPDGWSQIINNIARCNRKSTAAITKKMFEELDLEVGEIESAILIARNRFAHGVDVSIEEDRELYYLTNSAEALLNRILLKIMGYEGLYVDYSTIGYPSRNLSERLGGPKGDGRVFYSIP